MSSAFTQLRNHIVTGFVFIMPVLIVLMVLMKFWKNMLRVGSGLSRLMKVDTVLGPPGDAVIAVMFFLIICTLAGFLIQISFLKRASEGIDRQLSELIPGYSQLRAQATKKIGRDKGEAFDACLVQVQDLWQPGYAIERNPDGTQTVFVPQAPQFAVGQVYVVDAGRIKLLGIDSAALNAHLKKLGKGIMSRG